MEINHIITVAAAILGVIVGFLLDWIKSAFVKPELSVEYHHSTNKADAMKLPLINQETQLFYMYGWAYYFRMRVINKGRIAANSVEVFINSLEKLNDSGIYEKQNFLPMNLAWSFGRQIDPHEKRLIYFPSISPKMGKYCDIGHIYHPAHREQYHTRLPSVDAVDTDFRLDLAITTKSGFHVLSKGMYRIKFVVGATNAKPKQKTLQINLSGNWFDDEENMLKTGINIEIIK